MPPKVFKILDYITDGVKSSSKYWDDAVRTAREASHVTSDLRVPINSVQRNGYSNLQHAKSQYKYFQNPRLARYDFEQIAPLSEFQRYLPKGQVGDPFGAMKLLEGTTNPYLRSVHRELKSFYPIGKQLQLSPTEIQRQMDLRLRDLFNNMYRVNTPMIFKMGGKVEKFWPGGILGKGIKWVKSNHVARGLNNIVNTQIPKQTFDLNIPENHQIYFAMLPEEAFTSKSNPLSEIHSRLVPNKHQLKFVDDVTKGAWFARRNNIPVQKQLIDFTDAYNNRAYSYIGSGSESMVFDAGNGTVLKFNIGQRITPYFKLWDPKRYFKFELSSFKNINDLQDSWTKYLSELDKYWFSEPHNLVGYYKQGDNYYAVLSQRKMNRGSSYLNASPQMKSQLDYWGPWGKPKITNNNIFLENDLPMPHDVHRGNFMFDSDNVLRAIDIHKKGGII